MHRPVVLLPLPDSPTSAKVSPSSMLKLTPSTARTTVFGRNRPPPRTKCFSRLRTSTSGIRQHLLGSREPGVGSRRVQVAPHGVIVADDGLGRKRRCAVRHAGAAARRERAAGRQGGQVRHGALDGLQARTRAHRRESTPAARACRDGPAPRKMSRTGPCSTIRPAYMMATRSAISAMTPRSCVMSRRLTPNSRFMSRSRSRICACTVTSSAVVGSSAMTSGGRQASAMAIITRWRMPPDSWWG